MAILAMFSVAFPLLLMEMASGGLDVPTSRLLKTKLPGKRVIAGALMPMPLRGTVCGLPTALSTIMMAPMRVPVAVGVNVTRMLQLARAARLAPQLLVCAKSPLAVMLRLVTGSKGLVFVSVTLSVVLGVPTGWLAKFRLVGDSFTTGSEDTFTETVALLFAGTGSGSAAVTVSVFINVPAAVGVRTTVTVAFDPADSDPSVQVNGDVPEHVP
jgi:hypothetical protein